MEALQYIIDFNVDLIYHLLKSNEDIPINLVGKLKESHITKASKRVKLFSNHIKIYRSFDMIRSERCGLTLSVLLIEKIIKQIAPNFIFDDLFVIYITTIIEEISSDLLEFSCKDISVIKTKHIRLAISKNTELDILSKHINTDICVLELKNQSNIPTSKIRKEEIEFDDINIPEIYGEFNRHIKFFGDWEELDLNDE